MHIFYHEANGTLYARLGRSVRNGDKVSKESINLGRVIDKEKGIYKSRERGVFQYDLKTDTYTSISGPGEERELSLPGLPWTSGAAKAPGMSGAAKTPGLSGAAKASGMSERNGGAARSGSRASGVPGTEKAIVDLGDVFFLDAFLKKEGLDEIVDAVGYEDRDILYSLLLYRLLNGGDDRQAADWYDGSYASVLYPHGRPDWQQIGELYAAIGSGLSMQLFFSRYLLFLSERAAAEKKGTGGRPHKGRGAEDGYILIDSAGGGEGRLLYVVRPSTGMPVFFRYCQDKEADVDTLVRTIRELEAYKIFIWLAVLDAGYYSGDSIEELYAQKIAFITRPREDLRLYKKLAAESLSALVGQENFVSCDARYPYIKCVPCKVGRKNHPACTYVCLAPDEERIAAYGQLLDAKNRSLTDSDMHDMIQSGEILLFVSSERIGPDKIFPAYSTRRYMDPLFERLRTDRLDDRARARRVLWPGGRADGWSGGQAGGLAERQAGDQERDRVCGQLLLTFMADVIRKQIEDKLRDMPYTLDELFLNLRNQKGKVYRDRVIAQKASKKASDCYKRFKIFCPTEIRR